MPKKFFIFIILLPLMHFVWLKYNQWHLPSKFIQKKVCVNGVISSIPLKKFHGVQFVFSTKKVNHQNINTHFLISWYQYPPLLQVGQRWRLTVKLKPPVGVNNPGGFNYKDFLMHQGIAATGYVITHGVQNKKLGLSGLFFIDRLREEIQKEINTTVPNPTIAAFVSALSVGLRNGLDASDWQVFQKTGTNHLIAIAGLHIGFVFAAIYFLFDRVIRFFPRVLLCMPATHFASVTAFSVAFFYALLSGFALPAQRAILMLMMFVFSSLFYRNIPMFYRWALTALVVLGCFPFDIFDAGFWLSFGTVGFLILVMSSRLQAPSHVASWVRMQLTIMLGLMPLMCWYFQQISFVSFFANSVAIPLVGLLVLPLCFLASSLYVLHINYLSKVLFSLSGKCLYALWCWLMFVSHVSFSVWHHGLPTVKVLLIGVVAVLLLLSPSRFPAKWFGCFGLVPLFFYYPSSPSFGNFKATVIDVGQGLSVLIQTKNHVMLYDTGAHFPGGFDFGDSVVTPYLRRQGISTIDRLEISHGDNDHSGGASAIIQNFQVNQVVTSAPKLVRQLHGFYCVRGQQWRWDGVRFKTLAPFLAHPYEDNNSSCVIKVSGEYGQLLLTGDIQHQSESGLVGELGAQLHSTILIVPHHGSRTSSSDAFLTAVDPKYAVISAGKYNRYHLPAQSVLERYQDRHIILYNTAETGAVRIRFLSSGQVELLRN